MQSISYVGELGVWLNIRISLKSKGDSIPTALPYVSTIDGGRYFVIWL